MRKRDYNGYDLYDGLNVTQRLAVLEHPVSNAVITQFVKRSPINLRPVLGMPKTRLPKGVGLFLNAYTRMVARARRQEKSEDEQLTLPGS